MKKKGLIVAAFFGVIMVTSLAAGVLVNKAPLPTTDSEISLTGTPADNFPPAERARYCGAGIAKSTPFVTEYSIPTVCTNPLAIVNDPSGNVWFVQTNTGKVAKFDPVDKSFSEFDNPLWPKNGRSMMWGIDYSPDGALWYTDENYDSVWRFSIDDNKYQRFGFPSDGDALPQKLKVDGSEIVINDFSGNKITFLDPTQSEANLAFVNIPSPINGTVTGAFAFDENNNIWYTNWLYQQGGVLLKFNQDSFKDSLINKSEINPSMFDYFEVFQLPFELLTPNGMTISENGLVWLADTSSSAIFNFNPSTEQFIQYPTSDPKKSTYGNSTGVIKTPISRPYWIESDSQGRLIFNEQTANNIAVLDPTTESLVEYLIPSKNPLWADCVDMTDCGVAQIFSFSVYEDKIWFTEWVENNIGVVDTSIPLPFEINLDSTDVSLKAGEIKNLQFTTSSKSQNSLSDLSLILSEHQNFLNVTSSVSDSFKLNSNESKSVDVTISSLSSSPPGEYKVLLGAQIEDISISKFITVTIES